MVTVPDREEVDRLGSQAMVTGSVPVPDAGVAVSQLRCLVCYAIHPALKHQPGKPAVQHAPVPFNVPPRWRMLIET